MLTLYGREHPYCDGISRRSFLTIGGFTFAGVAGLSLADIYRVEAATGRRSPHKALINIFLAGGPPHQDLWDLKTDAPTEIRGEFKPIRTSVPGIEICEVFPRLARLMDRCAIIRSVVGCVDQHDSYHCMSGWTRRDLQAQGGYPSIGSVAARLLGPVQRSVPAVVGLAAPSRERRWSDSGSPGFLGAAYAPFKPFLTGEGNEQTQKLVGTYEQGPGLEIIQLKGMSLQRLQDRRRLLQALDAHRRDLENDLAVRDMDASTQAAFELLTSSRLANALDLSREDPKIVERYGNGRPYNYQYDGPPTVNEHLLLARRLVEAGCRCVTLSFGRWDSHGRNFDLVRDHGSKLDQCLSALIEDLDRRGMLDDVTVIAWGEFGRTPVINRGGGRDHWPQVSCALLAGGGMKVGQVIGSTNRLGEYADTRPVQMQEIVATLYHNLGIDPRSTTIEDRSGRPQYLLEHRDPVPELVA